MNRYSILDKKAGTYGTPFFSPTNATAIRSCEEAVSDTDTPYAKYPEDFCLFLLGTFDSYTADETIDDTRPCLIHFHELKKELTPG